MCLLGGTSQTIVNLGDFMKTSQMQTTSNAAVEAAVKQGIDASPGIQSATAEVSMMIPGHITQQALRVWDAAYDAYHKKGGIADLKAELEKLSGGLGQDMLELGKTCLKHVGFKYPEAFALFHGVCSQIEKTARAKARKVEGKEPTLQQILPTWSPNKATVGAALKKEVDLFQTVKETDKKGQEVSVPVGIGKVRALIRTNRGSQAGGTGGDALPAVQVSGALKAALVVLHKEIAAIPVQNHDKVAELITKLVPSIVELRTWEQPKLSAEQVENLPPIHGAVAEPAETKAEKRERAKRGGRKAA